MKVALITLSMAIPSLAFGSEARIELPAPASHESVARATSEAPETASWAALAGTPRAELGISSWTPSRMESQGFRSAGLPSIEGAYVSGRELGLLAGFGFSSLRRQGSLAIAGMVARDDQNAYLPQARFALEYEPSKLRTRALHPFADAGLSPTWVLEGASAFSDGSSSFGVPLYFRIGSEVDLGSLGAGPRFPLLTLAVLRTQGKAGSMDLSSTAFLGGFRVAL